ncbi:MAG TPA: bi-domain-containing oxidoreductase [Vicinamibacterales bacterium]|nr:bi-domain-containing oxidoreductase [Vicinamibacterales bacterium]
MKAVTQNLKTGTLLVQEVPSPILRPDGLLVRVRRSLISLGTERAVIALANKGPLGKAKDRPDLFRKVLNKAKQEGYWSTYKVVKHLMSTPIPLGYSCAGDVLEVGAAATEFHVGDRVACAGLGHANHAEIDYVPRNLAARMPDAVSYDDGCFVTVGTIALHGVRLAEIALGDRVVVIGLGLVGQITAQLARCSGAMVIASDIDPDKLEMAKRLGAHHVVPANSLASTVAELTGGLGADSVLLCAAAKSDEPMRQAAAVSRLKGRVIVVGDVGMAIERRPFFEKELTLLVSRSYGPGRYDPEYELRGRDYPAAYVRWTEGRNMQAFLDLLGRGDIQLAPLVTHRFAIDEAESAYDVVTGKRPEPAVAILLEYNGEPAEGSRVNLAPARPAATRQAGDQLRCGVIGAGQFAKGVLLPALTAQPGVHLQAVCTASGFTSRHVGTQYGAEYCTSDPDEVIVDPNVDALIIATRHDQHARLTAAAIRAGKAVFVEKPLAIDAAGLADVLDAIESSPGARLMVGFNRRFAPLSIRCREFFAGVAEPLFVSYRVNAGVVPADSWVLDPVEGGGRILGEICHFVDMCAFLGGALPSRIFAEEVGRDARSRQNVTVTLRLANGGVGVIHYMTTGDPAVPKEYVEVFGGGRTAQLDNFRRLSMFRDNRRRRQRLFNQAKGHAEEMAAFVKAVRGGGPMPMDLPSIVAVTEATFLIRQSLEQGTAIDYELPAALQGER